VAVAVLVFLLAIIACILFAVITAAAGLWDQWL
jgi:hypothetical protein